MKNKLLKRLQKKVRIYSDKFLYMASFDNTHIGRVITSEVTSDKEQIAKIVQYYKHQIFAKHLLRKKRITYLEFINLIK